MRRRKQYDVSAKRLSILPCKASERLICKPLALSACKHKRARNLELYIQFDTDKKENQQENISKETVMQNSQR